MNFELIQKKDEITELKFKIAKIKEKYVYNTENKFAALPNTYQKSLPTEFLFTEDNQAERCSCNNNCIIY